MKTYWIGRQPEVDIVLEMESISNLHAELVVTDDGEYFLTDCGSTNGTFRRKEGQWQRFRQAFITPDEPLRLGSLETTARKLLAKLGRTQGRHDVATYYHRNPATGNFERK
ncbi:MAG: FHA domain-containing protein [Magnetococcales bacterium]|nr:FHA domain-containing protein [Magnetococcales bacterium]